MVRSPLPLLILAGVALAANARAEEDEGDDEHATPVLVGTATSYAPPLRFAPRGMLLEVPLQLVGSLEGVSSYPVDRDLTAFELLNEGYVQARVGLRFNTRRAILPFNVALEYEHDVVSGSVGAHPRLEGAGLPGSEDLTHKLRKGYARVSLGYYLHLIGGFNVSHWGMGLLANDGAHGWLPGSARFSEPRNGDRVLRVALATGPVGKLALQAAIGFDWVQGDDVMLEGDSARQVIGAVTLGAERPSSVGIYAVYRQQEDRAGARTRVAVVDLYARHEHPLRPGLLARGELEAALVAGSTELGASALFPDKRVLQLGVGARAAVEGRQGGGVVDLFYASGDADTDDGQQNAFKADPNYDVGLLLFRQVLAGQTGRSVHTASDPNLVGRAAEGLERFPTRGSATNSLAIFPRFFWRPLAGAEIYGGPLFAFAISPYADPLNTRLAGGVARNPLNHDPGRYYGTELDLGARYHALLAGMLLEVGAEAGVLFPGSALSGTDARMGIVYGGRLLAGYRF